MATTQRTVTQRVVSYQPPPVGGAIVRAVGVPAWVPIVFAIIVAIILVAILIALSVELYYVFTRYGQQRTSDQAIIVIVFILIIVAAIFGAVAFLTKSRPGFT